MRKTKALLFLLLLAMFFEGCVKNKNDPEGFINYLKSLDSYSTEVNIKIINEKQNIEYNTIQYYDKRYGARLELGSDRVFLYKGDKIEVTDIKNDLKYTTDKDFDSLFHLSLLEEYIGLIYTNEKLDYCQKDIGDKKYQVIGLDIPGNNRNISSAEIYADIKTNVPEFIVIYDEKKSEKVRITYSKFLPDTEIQNKFY
ncbi:MAG: germination lipoprotein GerS-related protein [Solirubrobacterales bacterium]